MKKRQTFKCFAGEGEAAYMTATFDGYAFGDRLLEGCKFRATIDHITGEMKVKADDDTKKFLEGVGGKGAVKKWEKAALDYAEGNDLFTADNGEEVELISTADYPEEPRQAIPAREIKMTKLGDVLKKLQ